MKRFILATIIALFSTPVMALEVDDCTDVEAFIKYQAEQLLTDDYTIDDYTRELIEAMPWIPPFEVINLYRKTYFYVVIEDTTPTEFAAVVREACEMIHGEQE